MATKDAPKSFAEEAARLAGLSRAQRFAELITFPEKHMFKLIGRRDGFGRAVNQALGALGHENVVLIERRSATGRYVSLTFEISVASAGSLDALYSALEQIPGLVYVL
jgi:putative lipoic acid-binding regulatory protein